MVYSMFMTFTSGASGDLSELVVLLIVEGGDSGAHESYCSRFVCLCLSVTNLAPAYDVRAAK